MAQRYKSKYIKELPSNAFRPVSAGDEEKSKIIGGLKLKNLMARFASGGRTYSEIASKSKKLGITKVQDLTNIKKALKKAAELEEQERREQFKKKNIRRVKMERQVEAAKEQVLDEEEGELELLQGRTAFKRAQTGFAGGTSRLRTSVSIKTTEGGRKRFGLEDNSKTGFAGEKNCSSSVSRPEQSQKPSPPDLPNLPY